MSTREGRDNPMDNSREELDLLLSALLDGDFTAQQHASLQDILRHDAEARRYYLRFMRIHAKLQWSTGQAFPQLAKSAAHPSQHDTDADLTMADLADLMRLEERAEIIRVQSDIKQPHSPAGPAAESYEFRRAIATLCDPSFVRFVAVNAVRFKPVQWMAVAALLAISVLLGIALLGPVTQRSETAAQQTLPNPPDNASQRTSQAVVAKLTGEHNAAWDRQPGQDLYASQVFTLTQGFAEITTALGTVAIFEAPATFELLDHDNAVYLHAGKLVGLCHTPASKGFIVKTDHADITDLGTEFGVMMRNDSLEASVFVGEIQIVMPTGVSQNIAANRTARISYTAGLSHLVVEDEAGQGYTRRTPRPRLVMGASINLPDFEVNVLHQGVYEDVKLFTDREHQLNGIDQEGLPSLLIGGDLIQMPASARPELNPQIGKQLKLEIDVSMPAEIYLLIEKGTELEPWVQEQYVKTPMRAGNDHLVQSDGRRLGIGPGISIDRTFEIWKRRAPVTERTTIGGAMDGTMYAVIAVPVQEAEATKTQ